VRKKIALALLALNFAFTAVVYGSLPDRIPTHFGMHGPDAWSGRAAAWLVPVIALAIYSLMQVLPRLDPRRANYAKFQDTYDTVVLAIVAMDLVLQVGILGSALGWPVGVDNLVPLGVGGLFIVLGNVMPRARPNWFLGIRTPWTLSNDLVWERTHRVGGYLFMIAGVLMMTLSFLRSPAVVNSVIGVMIALTLGTIPYSYFIWRKVVGPIAPGRPPIDHD
jgi:uncharacterized membrane protein